MTIVDIFCHWCETYHFLFGAQHAQLAEAHVEWRALVGAISLADDHDVYAARQRGLVDAFVQFLDGDQHLTCQLAHVVHGVGLNGGKNQILAQLAREMRRQVEMKRPEKESDYFSLQ